MSISLTFMDGFIPFLPLPFLRSSLTKMLCFSVVALQPFKLFWSF